MKLKKIEKKFYMTAINFLFDYNHRSAICDTESCLDFSLNKFCISEYADFNSVIWHTLTLHQNKTTINLLYLNSCRLYWCYTEAVTFHHDENDLKAIKGDCIAERMFCFFL